MSFTAPFLDLLAASLPAGGWHKLGVLVAVSGGADSAALLRGLHALRRVEGETEGFLVAAHFNHGLRGAEADADARFTANLAESLGIACHVGRAHNTRGESAAGEGLEGKLRAARYEFLRKTAERIGARFVVTAHTSDDQVETVLHRVLRGTGLAGLAGIPRTRLLSPAITLLRPMLTISRATVLEYLQSIGQPWREDATNADHQFTRNRLRGGLLPNLRENYNPEIDLALARLAETAAENRNFVEHQAEWAIAETELPREGAAIVLDAHRLAAIDPYLLREALLLLWRREGWPLRDMSREQWLRLAGLAAGAEGSAIGQFPGGITAERRGDEFRLKPP